MQLARSVITMSTVAALWLPVGQAYAQSADEAAAACNEAASLIAENDFVGALAEAEWCVESLRQLRQQLTLTVFPDEVDGYTGGELQNQSAMGMTVIERTYTRGDSSVDVSLTGGIAGAGLAALAQFASGMGNAGGAKTRAQKRTVIDMSSEGGNAEYMVQLKSGGMLMVSSYDLNSEAVLEFIRAFPIEALDDSMNE